MTLRTLRVEKFFIYPLQAHPAGRAISRSNWQSVIDVNGIPYSPLPEGMEQAIVLIGV